ncbi:uncharacterized protein VTP21DRAFT_9608 [Calcarisporiella thermophila]|uniref:uncharacterized protein n=1 Tax=Calcarisporiella thermophila TaxID=911321 RepID=UPI003742B05E
MSNNPPPPSRRLSRRPSLPLIGARSVSGPMPSVRQRTISATSARSLDFTNVNRGGYYPAQSASMLTANTGGTIQEGNTDKEAMEGLARETFERVNNYIQAEILAAGEDYKLLETMNLVTRDRYSAMREQALHITKEMNRVGSNFEQMRAYIQQIDEVCKQVDYLEAVAIELDDYTKYLESKLKLLVSK